MRKAHLGLLLLGAGLILFSGFLAAAAMPAAPLPVQPRTALPTWTLPFLLVTLTPAPAAEMPLPVATVAASQPAPTLVPPTSIPPTAIPPTPTPAAPPRLVIPALEIDRSIIPVLIVDGSWDMTPLDQQIGWLTTTGAEPGADLAMTFAGHVNLSLGNAGPFRNLKKLDVGDEVIYRAGGLDYVYMVQDQSTVKPDEVDALYVDNGRQLILVTCSSWSYFWSHYARRLIVTTELVSTTPSP